MEFDRSLSFCERLRLVRTLAGFTQEQLAWRLGLTGRSYQNYESGRTHPSLSTVVEIADLFDVSTDWLLGRDDFLDKHEAPFGGFPLGPQDRPK
ncbi:helix-turn-helix domain-containing protein [Adlercreutzia equolifaciens]|uniref:helix-turn-helix domain-containing protein n=1 Tax=Adlercreutzia equolifaciens TaxID=446660 RepID=UPI003A918150